MRPSGRLRDIDAADRAQLLRVVVYFGPPCFTILSFLWYFLREQGWISGAAFVALLLLNVPLTVAGIVLIHRAAGAAGDHEARLRLAELLETRLEGFDEAERLYREVRRLAPEPRHELRAANGLIDLYRKTGRRDRLQVELARFADRYRGTVAGAAAARELRELKGDDLTSESPRSPR